MLNSILPFIVLILVVVFIHEYGHYYFARKYGVGVTDFSIGFGKEIFGWNDKSGTRWKICWIPLGGYVKFFGDRNVFSQSDQEEILKKYSIEEQKKLFILKPLYQRSLIVAAGPFANFVLAIVIFFFIYTFVGKDFTPAVINEVKKDSPAYVAGLKKNDIIVKVQKPDSKLIHSMKGGSILIGLLSPRKGSSENTLYNKKKISAFALENFCKILEFRFSTLNTRTDEIPSGSFDL